MSRLLISLALLACLPSAILSQQETASIKPRVPEADYTKWETLGAGALSPDGKWVAYDFRRVNGTGELRYQALGADAAASDHAVRNGANPVFTRNSRWLLYTILPDTAGGRAGGAGRGGRGGGGRGGGAGDGATAANHNKVGIVDLRSGATAVLEDVQSFQVSANGTHVALRRYAPQGRQSRGADLVVRNLDDGSDITLGNVAEFAWNETGMWLAMVIDVEGKTGNGVQALQAATGTLRSLDAGDMLYANLQWREKSDDLAAMRSRSDSTFADTSYAVIAWRGLGSASAAKQVYDFTTDRTFPAGMRVASYRAPQWSDDGATLFFGIAPREPKPPADRRTSGPQPARVEVWHAKDLRTYHTQDRQAAQDRQRTHLVAWHVAANRLVRLADDSLETIQLSESRRAAIATDDRPYFMPVISGRSYRDVYRVDLATGKRDKVITKAAFQANISPSGKYLLYQQGGHWWSLDLSSGTRADVTANARSVFVDMEDDHPVHERRAYGLGAWTTGEKSVLLYDRFDVWQVNLDGTNPVRLTRGKEDSTVYRVVALDAETGPFFGGAPRTVDPAKPITLSATGEWNKKSGYARLTIGQPVQRLIWRDKAVGRLTKAKDADVYLFVEQSYQSSPDFFTAGVSLSDAKQISHTNAFQGEYAWGKQSLMNYTNSRGDRLQMMLTYPAGYQPGKKYPMVVYYYEKLSQGFHQYIVPTERAMYNITVFSQEGYFVLRPDILFRARDAGYSGLDCVTSAVKAALAAVPDIDPKHVGNMGHSWGGYQSAFYAVHGKGVFAASIAGAPLTNFISMYGYTSFNTGAAETGHFETGQERMQVSLWEDPKAYVRNSTVFAVDSLQIPLLLEEGDADGNVNYWQAMELYNFGRRLGKNVVFLIYNGENHGLARPESQADYHRRQIEWFAHYLKGEPAADWITNGETYLARQRLLREAGVTDSPNVSSGQPAAAPVGGRGRGGGAPNP